MKLTFNVMSRNGHDQEVFDRTDEEAIAKAMARFHELVSEKKYLAYTRGKDARKVSKFEDIKDTEEVVFNTPLIGG